VLLWAYPGGLLVVAVQVALFLVVLACAVVSLVARGAMGFIRVALFVAVVACAVVAAAARCAMSLISRIVRGSE